MEITTVDNPKIKPKILTAWLLMTTRRTIPIITIRIQNFSRYPFCPCCAFAFRSSRVDSAVTDVMIFITSLCDTQKLPIDITPPISTASANAGDTTTAEPSVRIASTIQLITCIFCSVNDSSITQLSSPLSSAFPDHLYFARGSRASSYIRQQYQKPGR